MVLPWMPFLSLSSVLSHGMVLFSLKGLWPKILASVCVVPWFCFASLSILSQILRFFLFFFWSALRLKCLVIKFGFLALIERTQSSISWLCLMVLLRVVVVLTSCSMQNGLTTTGSSAAQCRCCRYGCVSASSAVSRSAGLNRSSRSNRSNPATTRALISVEAAAVCNNHICDG